MKKLPIAIRLTAYCCVALLVFVVLAQPTLGLLFVLLLPFWFFVEFVVVAPAPVFREDFTAPEFFAVPGFSPRPPPAL
jgi:hypothetical protein